MKSRVQPVGIIMVFILLAACIGNETTVKLPPTAVPAPATTSVGKSSSATVAPLPVTRQPASAPADTQAGSSLAAHGPWLVYHTDRGLGAVSADGASHALLTGPLYLANDDLSGYTISANGGWAALRVGEDRITGVGTVLQLLHLPDGKLRPITRLLSPDLENAMADARGDRVAATDAGIAITLKDTARWSPDGQHLAFVGAIDGPSADLYVYDVQNQKIKRLSDGPGQVAQIFWSPDSQRIVFEEVTDFGIGAGYTLKAKAVWTAAPDGSGATRLYTAPAYSGNEVFVAWSAPDTMVVYTWTAGGLRDARAVNVNSGKVAPIHTAPFFDAFAFDPQSGTAVYAVSEATARDGGPARGLYLESPGHDQPQLIDPGEWHDLVWSPYAGQFFASGDAGILGMTPAGETTRFDQESLLPAVSLDGNWQAFWGDGYFTQPAGLRLYARNGQLQRNIMSDSVSLATWSPDAQGIFYVSNGALYFVRLPDGQPISIDKGVQASSEGGLGWVP